MGYEKEKEKTRQSKEYEKEHDTVFIGQKPIGSYILAVLTQFGKGTKEIVLKARGRAISKAVDVAEILHQRNNTQTKNIKTATEKITQEDGKKINVSTIEITITK